MRYVVPRYLLGSSRPTDSILFQVATILKEHNVSIWVRRAGPNYQEGLKNMKAATQELGLDAHIFGPEMHVSGIVPLALIPGKFEEAKASGLEEFKA